MTSLSRRTVLKTSPLAAIALCLPEPLCAGTTDPALMGKSGALGRGLVDAIAVARLHRRMRDGQPENKYNFRPVPEVRSFGQQMVHIAEANGSIMEMHVEGKQKMSWPYSGDGVGVVRSSLAAPASPIQQAGRSGPRLLFAAFLPH